MRYPTEHRPSFFSSAFSLLSNCNSPEARRAYLLQQRGVVYRATWQGVEVAVKALRTGGALLAQQELEMLLTEAATLASLRHPNVVAFLGVCLDIQAEPMLVTEFVGGGSLDLRLYPQAGAATLTPVERRRVASGVAAGLVHIHSKPLVHRDLKPANVLLTADQTAKVADVGLARVALAELALEVWAAAVVVVLFVRIFWPGNAQVTKEKPQ